MKATRAAAAMWCCLAVAQTVGCASEADKVKKIFDEELARCKATTSTFHEVKLFDKSTKKIVRAACDQPLEAINVEGYGASAKMGPYYWRSSNNKELGIWVLAGVEWEELETAQKRRAMEDPTLEIYKEAEGMLAKAETQLPESTFVRKLRLTNQLDIARKSRKGKKAATDLGPAAKYFGEIVTWAKGKDNLAVAAEAQLEALAYYKSYIGFLETAKESLGGHDEWIEKAIREAEKEKDKESAEKYRKELETSRANRDGDMANLEKRQAEVHKNACDLLASIKADGIKDDNVKDKVVASKGSIDCSPPAPPADDQPKK